VTPSPAPYPSAGGDVTGWTCESAPSPQPTPDPADTVQSCAVTGWQTRPPTTLADEQWGVIAFGLGLLVFLCAAVFVASWRASS
jgi:hypothetical protein